MYKITYICDGETQSYNFVFPFFQNADVRIALDDTVISPEQYTVFPNSDFTGGSVLLNSAPASGVRMDIFRQIALNRVIDYQPTAEIDPECLNSDFNFLLSAFSDLRGVDLDLAEWANTHDTIKQEIEYALELIQEKTTGGGALGLYNNLVSVLNGALPNLINDYGLITDVAPNENRDDYGVL